MVTIRHINTRVHRVLVSYILYTMPLVSVIQSHPVVTVWIPQVHNFCLRTSLSVGCQAVYSGRKLPAYQRKVAKFISDYTVSHSRQQLHPSSIFPPPSAHCASIPERKNWARVSKTLQFLFYMLKNCVSLKLCNLRRRKSVGICFFIKMKHIITYTVLNSFSNDI